MLDPLDGLAAADGEREAVELADADFEHQAISTVTYAAPARSLRTGGLASCISAGIVDMGAYEFVFTPSMEVARLILLVNDSDLGKKNKQPLLATLSAALASFERGSLHSGANQLHAFQNKVRAQVTRIDAALADELINAAQQIIEKVTNR